MSQDGKPPQVSRSEPKASRSIGRVRAKIGRTGARRSTRSARGAGSRRSTAAARRSRPARAGPPHGARAHRGAGRPGSFREHGPHRGRARARRRRRAARVHARELRARHRRASTAGRCVVGGDDFTLRGGSPSPAGLRKSVFAEDLALRLRVPLVRLLEGGGGSVPRASVASSARRRGGDGARPGRTASSSIARALAPCRWSSAALGAVAGLPAARLVASHFSVMTRETAQVLIARPRAGRARARRTRRQGRARRRRSAPARAASSTPCATTSATHSARSAASCPICRRTSGSAPPRAECDDPRDRAEEELLAIVPRDRRRAYNMRAAPRARARPRLASSSWARLRPHADHGARAARRPAGRRDRQRSATSTRGSMTRRRRAEGAPLRRALRHLPSPDRRASSTSRAS